MFCDFPVQILKLSQRTWMRYFQYLMLLFELCIIDENECITRRAVYGILGVIRLMVVVRTRDVVMHEVTYILHNPCVSM